jgi:hypothetical protein
MTLREQSSTFTESEQDRSDTKRREPSRRWLESLPEHTHNQVAQLTLRGVRTDGASTPLAVVLSLALRIGGRIGGAWGNPVEQSRLTPVADALTTDPLGALAYGAYAIWWEGLPAEERDRLKQERARQYQQEAMATQLPTPKQLAYLDALDYRGPTPTSKAEASALIDQRKRETGR